MGPLTVLLSTRTCHCLGVIALGKLSGQIFQSATRRSPTTSHILKFPTAVFLPSYQFTTTRRRPSSQPSPSNLVRPSILYRREAIHHSSPKEYPPFSTYLFPYLYLFHASSALCHCLHLRGGRRICCASLSSYSTELTSIRG